MRRPDVLDAFSYARFRRVWVAGFVSQLGDWMQIIGRALLAYRLTGSAESVGFVYFATYAPQTLFALWGGVLADRVDRRRLLLATNVAQATGAIVMGVLVTMGTATVLNITLLSFAIGTATMLNIPAGQAHLSRVLAGLDGPLAPLHPRDAGRARVARDDGGDGNAHRGGGLTSWVLPDYRVREVADEGSAGS